MYTILDVANHQIPILDKQKKDLAKFFGIGGGAATF
jgi:hypothetical protein